MASPQLEDGFARIAVEIMQAFARTHVPGRHGAVLWAVLCETYGAFDPEAGRWGMVEAVLPAGRLAALTGLTANNVRVCIADLRRWQMLRHTSRGPGRAALLGIQKDHERWAVPRFGERGEREGRAPRQGRAAAAPATQVGQAPASDPRRVGASDSRRVELPEPGPTRLRSEAGPASDSRRVGASDLRRVSAPPILTLRDPDLREREGSDPNRSAVPVRERSSPRVPGPGPTPPPLDLRTPDPDPDPDPIEPDRTEPPEPDEERPPAHPSAAELFAAEYFARFGIGRTVGAEDALALERHAAVLGPRRFCAAARVFFDRREAWILKRAHSAWAFEQVLGDCDAVAQRHTAAPARLEQRRAAPVPLPPPAWPRTAAQLRERDSLRALWASAVAARWVQPGELGGLEVIAAAQAALRCCKVTGRDPCETLRKILPLPEAERFVDQVDVDAARALLREWNAADGNAGLRVLNGALSDLTRSFRSPAT